MHPEEKTPETTLPEVDADSPWQWLELHGDYLYSFALSKVRRSDVAEDLLQETLLAAWKSKNNFKGDSNARTWLTSILRHKIVDWLRKKVRESNVKSADHESLEYWFSATGKWKRTVNDWRTTPDVEYSEFLGVLHDCSNRLPTNLRETFVLWHLEEQSTDDVCKSLSIKPAHLWVMLHRARLRMWECLGRNWFQSDRSEAP